MSLSGFPYFTAEYSEGKYSILSREQKITVYTDRSQARDMANFSKALQDAKSGHKLLIIAPWHENFLELLQQPLIFIAPIAFSSTNHPNLIANDAQLETFINAIVPEDNFDIYMTPAWGIFHNEIQNSAQNLLERAAVRLKTIQHFARLWQINFRVNAPNAAAYGDITELKKLQPPQALVMAGPSLDSKIPQLRKLTSIWCADTAFAAVAQRGIFPQVVFSVDGGFASREHFSGLSGDIRSNKMILVCDLLGNPAVQRLPFARVLTYASSHPLLQLLKSFTPLENPNGDVGSLMRTVEQKFFRAKDATIIGHDGGHRRLVTHARGTAYFTRSYANQTRLNNVESYMFKLSRRYPCAVPFIGAVPS